MAGESKPMVALNDLPLPFLCPLPFSPLSSQAGFRSPSPRRNKTEPDNHWEPSLPACRLGSIQPLGAQAGGPIKASATSCEAAQSPTSQLVAKTLIVLAASSPKSVLPAHSTIGQMEPTLQASRSGF